MTSNSLKSLALALLSTLLLVVASTAAEARSHVNFFVGVGPGPYYDAYPYDYSYGPSYGYYPYAPYYAPYPMYRPEPVYAPGISCFEGVDIVRSRGFHNVRVGECNGAVYSYTGWRNGVPFRIKVQARTGRILGAYPA